MIGTIKETSMPILYLMTTKKKVSEIHQAKKDAASCMLVTGRCPPETYLVIMAAVCELEKYGSHQKQPSSQFLIFIFRSLAAEPTSEYGTLSSSAIFLASAHVSLPDSALCLRSAVISFFLAVFSI